MSENDERFSIVGTRFTAAQREWLESEGTRLDRPLSWVIRNIVAIAMGERKPQPIGGRQIRRKSSIEREERVSSG